VASGNVVGRRGFEEDLRVVCGEVGGGVMIIV
jgi:hypothetical protein